MRTCSAAVGGFLFFFSIFLFEASAHEMGALGYASAPVSPPAERISRSKGVFGIGVVLGEPSGISGKYWLSENTAVDGAFGYSFGDRYRFSMDYLIHQDAFESPDFLLHYGIGGAVAGDRGYVTKSRAGNFALGVRGVIGIDYLFKRAPLDAFLEVAPIMFIAPPFGLSIDFCFGIRVYP